MEVDLATLSHEQVGAIHGKINRSVEGYVRFLRITFLDFFPAIFMGELRPGRPAFTQAAEDRDRHGRRGSDLDGA